MTIQAGLLGKKTIEHLPELYAKYKAGRKGKDNFDEWIKHPETQEQLKLYHGVHIRWVPKLLFPNTQADV